MGLPLFVAPVESDIPNRPSEKSAAAPPHRRSSIRRARRLDEREQRAARRRSVAVEASLNRGFYIPFDFPPSTALGRQHAPAPHYPPSPRSRVPIPPRRAEFYTDLPVWARSHLSAEQRDSIAGGERPARDPGHRRFRPSPDDHEESDPMDWVDPSEDWGTVRARVLREGAPASLLLPYMHPEGRTGDDQPSSRRSGLPDTISRFARSPPRRSLGRLARRHASNPRSVSFREFGARQQEDMDGLGDRDRSLSPEGDSAWDTLQMTLTPDPQPPSVGSSFASATASASGATSQSAAGSSRTSIVEPETADDGAAEQACESGCENTDSEQDDGAMWMSLESYSARARRGDSAAAGGRGEGGNADDTDGAERPRRRPGYNYDGSGLIPTSHERSRLTPGAEARGESQATTEAERSPSTNHNSTAGQSDDDLWGGMQRIVRNLARREDIPDEWWAEAGLSRTLPQGPSN